MNPFSLVKKHLQFVEELRFEWSVKIDEHGVYSREKLLFWIEKEESANNASSFHVLTNLLKSLDCPKEILETRKLLEAETRTEGIRIDLKEIDSIHCLYVDHFTDETNKTIEAFHWCNGNVVKTAEYSFHLFSEMQSNEEPLSCVHDELKDSFVKLCSNNRIRLQSGFGYQHRDGKIQEVYLTYFWHPQVNFIVNDLPKSMREILLKSTYMCLPFRHIGFSTTKESQPVVTLYFSGPFRNHWPNNFSEFQAEVSKSSKLLVEELSLFGGLEI